METAEFATAEGDLLVVLKCDLLAGVTASDGQVPLGAEAPRGRARACFIELVNIHLVGTADAITFAAMAAPYFEMPIIFVSGELRWGEPASDIDTGVVDGPKVLDPDGRLRSDRIAAAARRACLKSANERNPLARERAAREGRSE